MRCDSVTSLKLVFLTIVLLTLGLLFPKSYQALQWDSLLVQCQHQGIHTGSGRTSQVAAALSRCNQHGLLSALISLLLRHS